MSFLSSSSPGLRARVVPAFPARVVANSPITLTKSGLTYTFGFDSAAANFSTLNIANNGVINFGAGDVLCTFTPNDISWTGATNYRFDAQVNIGGTCNLLNGKLQFPAIQAPSADVNCLDDYEEGTWVPVLTFATPGNLVVVYSVQLGGYVKVGKKVTVSFNITTSTFTFTTASGNLQVTGLPFTSENTVIAIGPLLWRGITKASYTQVSGFLAANSNILNLTASGSGQADALITAADTPTAGTVRLCGSLTYTVP